MSFRQAAEGKTLSINGILYMLDFMQNLYFDKGLKWLSFLWHSDALSFI